MQKYYKKMTYTIVYGTFRKFYRVLSYESDIWVFDAFDPIRLITTKKSFM